MGGGQSGKRGILGKAHRARDAYQQNASITDLVDTALDQDDAFKTMSDELKTALRTMLIATKEYTFWNPDEAPADETAPYCGRFIPWIRSFTTDDDQRYAIAKAFIHVQARHLAEAGSVWHDIDQPGRWDIILEDALADLYTFRNFCRNQRFRESQAYNPRRAFDPTNPN